jgi:hypothetical protein
MLFNFFTMLSNNLRRLSLAVFPIMNMILGIVNITKCGKVMVQHFSEKRWLYRAST